MPRVRDLYANCRTWWEDPDGSVRTIELHDGRRLSFERDKLATLLIETLTEIVHGPHTPGLEARAALVFRLCSQDEIEQAQELLVWAAEQEAS
jgi:hypothetical protein